MSLNGRRIYVPAGSLMVSSKPTILATVGLGSCVAVAIDDPASGIGGLAHIFLPSSDPISEGIRPARYASSAIPLLIERILEAGAERERLRARLAGGATIFPELHLAETKSVGMRNADRVRETLSESGIPILGESMGGRLGRSVELHLADGQFIVTAAGAAEAIL